MTEKKRCEKCAYFWLNGSGYSDWTWEDTEAMCALGLNEDFPASEKYEGLDKMPEMEFAEKCGKYQDSYDKEPPLVSPDGELQKGEGRAARLIRLLSK